MALSESPTTTTPKEEDPVVTKKEETTLEDDSNKRKAPEGGEGTLKASLSEEPYPRRRRTTIRKDESKMTEEERRKLEEKRAYSRLVSQRARQRTKDEIAFLASKAEKQTARVEELESELKQAKEQVRVLTIDNERLSALATRALSGGAIPPHAATGAAAAGMNPFMGMGAFGAAQNPLLMQQMLAAQAAGFGANPALAGLGGMHGAGGPPGGAPGGPSSGDSASGVDPKTNPLIQRSDEK